MGGAGAGQIDAAAVAEFGQWPPTVIGLFADASRLPMYTTPGSVVTLPPQMLFWVGGTSTTAGGATQQTVMVDASVAGNGWANSRDNTPG